MDRKKTIIIIVIAVLVAVAALVVYYIWQTSKPPQYDLDISFESSEDSGSKPETTGEPDSSSEEATEPETEPATEPEESESNPAEESESAPTESESASSDESASGVPEGEPPYYGRIYNNPPEPIEEEVPNTDHEHKWELVSTDLNDDKTQPWTETYECSVCKVQKKVTFPAEKHHFTEEVIEPSCTEEGYTLMKCTDCGYIYKDKIKEALGHDFGQWVEAAGGKETRECSRCGVIEERDAPTADSANLVIGEVEANPGDTVSVPVSLQNNPGICAFVLSFDYDEDYLTLEDVKASDSLGGEMNYATKAAWFAFSDYKDDGEILTLVFKVSPDAPKHQLPVSVEYQPGDICNFNEEDVNFIVVPGVVNVK